MARFAEGLIVGAIKDHAAGAVAGVLFTIEELEPDTTSATRWAQIDVDLEEEVGRKVEWNTAGLARFYIRARKTLADIFAAEKVANSLSDAFRDITVTVDSSTVTKGYIKFNRPTSEKLGEGDGVIEHYWQCDFFTNSI